MTGLSVTSFYYILLIKVQSLKNPSLWLLTYETNSRFHTRPHPLSLLHLGIPFFSSFFFFTRIRHTVDLRGKLLKKIYLMNDNHWSVNMNKANPYNNRHFFRSIYQFLCLGPSTNLLEIWHFMCFTKLRQAFMKSLKFEFCCTYH